jgi:hypothetical protein
MEKYILLKQRWDEIRFELRVNWQRLTTEELSDTQGNPEEIITLLQKKYGYSTTSARNMLNDFLQRFSQTPEHMRHRNASMPNPERLMH